MPEERPLARPPLPTIYPKATVKQAIGAASAATAALDASVVRVVSTVDCYLAFGSAPTATNSSMFLPANTVEYFAFTPGGKIAVLRDSADGSLFVTTGN